MVVLLGPNCLVEFGTPLAKVSVWHCQVKNATLRQTSSNRLGTVIKLAKMLYINSTKLVIPDSIDYWLVEKHANHSFISRQSSALFVHLETIFTVVTRWNIDNGKSSQWHTTKVIVNVLFFSITTNVHTMQCCQLETSKLLYKSSEIILIGNTVDDVKMEDA